jgi:hypothetical protein
VIIFFAAEFFTGRTDVQCLHCWQKVLNPKLVKGPWTKAEDEMIVELVNKYGKKKVVCDCKAFARAHWKTMS